MININERRNRKRKNMMALDVKGRKLNGTDRKGDGDECAITAPLRTTGVISTLITVNYINEQRQNSHNIRSYMAELRAE